MKVKNSIDLERIQQRDRQFLIEKIIHGVEFSSPYSNSVEKKPEIIDTVESSYRIIIRVYQQSFTDIADIFFKYIHSLDADEVQQLDDNLQSSRWGAIDFLKIENTSELLSLFQLFYHNNGRLPKLCS